jgi:hypothetical protein
LGQCDAGHRAVLVSGVTWSFRDWKDNLLVDREAPVLAWRQEKGHRLGWENSHEALAWNVFRGLELAGAADVVGGWFALGPPEILFWARHADGSPWPPFEAARLALDEHLRGPDVNYAAPDVVLRAGSEVVFVDVGLASPLGSPPLRWFSSAATPAARRRRRAILEAMLAEEPDVDRLFRRGLDETIRRGFYSPARRLLLARATARRLEGGGRGRLAILLNPATMRRSREDAERFRALLGPAGNEACQVIAWSDLTGAIPASAQDIGDYLAAKTVNRVPADLIGRPTTR